MVESQAFVVVVEADVLVAAALFFFYFFVFVLDRFCVRGYSVASLFKLEVTESEVVLVRRLFRLHIVC